MISALIWGAGLRDRRCCMTKVRVDSLHVNVIVLAFLMFWAVITINFFPPDSNPHDGDLNLPYLFAFLSLQVFIKAHASTAESIDKVIFVSLARVVVGHQYHLVQYCLYTNVFENPGLFI